MKVCSYIQELPRMDVQDKLNFIDAVQARQAWTDLIDERTAVQLASTFQALADPTRVRMVSALMPGELCVADLAGLLGMTQSAISHQLRILRALHIVRARREGRVVYYTLEDEHIRDLFNRGLEHIHYE
jgi:ArsR family transcriptional regulator, lead/cadmium/zinc/bismuth-responsive transcriptional repressor